LANQPLSSGDQIKLLVFALIFAPTVGFLVGIIPAIFLVFGLYMMKKNQDFSSIETAVTYFKGYTWLVFIGWVIFTLFLALESNSELVISLLFAAISFIYITSSLFIPDSIETTQGMGGSKRYLFI
jgi:hypothetical protein